MNIPVIRSTAHWSAGLHHDGSALFVSNPLPAHGEHVKVTFRAPANAPIRSAFIRTAPDGENHLEPMAETGRNAVSAWWTGDLRATMPRNPYRFKLYTDEGIYHLSAAGVSRAEHPDWGDFKLLADYEAPTWLESTVFYQIFPDRFAQGDPSLMPAASEWTIGRSGRTFSVQQRPWGAPPLAWREAGNLDFYGGDLPGIVQKIGYLADLGINALYLTPIFSSYSNHRYDVADFEQIDPHLGGNAGLAALRQALDSKAMRLILDVTLNHCGWRNNWFLQAQADLRGPFAEYFTFYSDDPNNYEAWMGTRTLPKFNYRSEALRDQLYRAPDSVLRRWLHEPYRIDGWRLDVANMQGRQGAIQLGHKMGRQLRRAVKSDAPQAYIYGEHYFDGTPHLQGDELDASMNYRGFTFPLWQWLAGRELLSAANDPPLYMFGQDLIEQWRLFRAAIPWAIARQQFNLLDSHDTPRLLNLLGGDKALFRLALVLLIAYPGVPCLYYGSEIGLPGDRDPDNRRCMPWDERAWDTDLRAFCQKLIGMRRTEPALQRGGYQDLYAAEGLIAFQRQSLEQRLIVVGFRGPDSLPDAMIPVWPGGIQDGARLTDRLSGRQYSVENGMIHVGTLSPGTALILEE